MKKVLFILFFTLSLLLISLLSSPSNIATTSTSDFPKNDIEFGKYLFEDKNLSHSKSVSCSTCHKPDNYFQDGLDRGLANNAFLRRNTPTLLNIDFYNEYFWDGKSKTLEGQMDGPLFSKAEMGNTEESISDYIKSNELIHYKYLEDKKLTGINETEFVKKYIVLYIKSISTKEITTDHEDEYPLSVIASEGKRIFYGKAGCASCHTGRTFTDNAYHDNGLFRRKTTLQGIYDNGVLQEETATYDFGRGDIVSGSESMFKFRTPSLVNIAYTSPYMHDGSLPTLESVIDFYSRGGDNPSTNMERLELNQEEKLALVEFLKSIKDINIAEKEVDNGN